MHSTACFVTCSFWGELSHLTSFPKIMWFIKVLPPLWWLFCIPVYGGNHTQSELAESCLKKHQSKPTWELLRWHSGDRLALELRLCLGLEQGLGLEESWDLRQEATLVLGTDSGSVPVAGIYLSPCAFWFCWTVYWPVLRLQETTETDGRVRQAFNLKKNTKPDDQLAQTCQDIFSESLEEELVPVIVVSLLTVHLVYQRHYDTLLIAAPIIKIFLD